MWLDRYCAPGRHEFAPWRMGTLTCTICSKEELAGGATCLICGIPGEYEVAIENTAACTERYSGKLCGTCSDEFASRHTIRGWHLVRSLSA